MRELQKKLQIARQLTPDTISSFLQPSHRRRALVRSSPKKKMPKKKVKVVELTDAEKWDLERQELLKTIHDQRNQIMSLESKILTQEGRILYLERDSLMYENLKKNAKMFYMLSGLTLEQFDILINCVEPYLTILDSGELSTPSYGGRPSELLSLLTLCRHGLQVNFMAFVFGTSNTTMQRIVNNWTLFLATVFNRIDLKPEHGFLIEKMPSSFVETGHGLTDLVLDATEFKFQFATNYDINSLLFSLYKNHSTGKALIGIAPHGMGIQFSDVYPGSISDTEITSRTEFL